MTGEQAAEDAIRLTLTVPAPAERAFAVFAEGFASWYPSEYTWSQDVLDTIAIEGRWVDRVVGLDGVRAEIAVVQTPDGHGRLELTKSPPSSALARWDAGRTKKRQWEG